MSWIWVNAIVGVVALGVGVGPIVVAILLDARQSRFRSDVTRDIALLTDGPTAADSFAGTQRWAVLTAGDQGSPACVRGSRVAADRSDWRPKAAPRNDWRQRVSSRPMAVVVIQATDRSGGPGPQLNARYRDLQPRDLQPRAAGTDRVHRLTRVRALLAHSEATIEQLASAGQRLPDKHIPHQQARRT